MVVLARWCVRRRKLVLAGWLALLVGLGFLLGTVGTAFSNSSRLPASDSSTAYTLLGNAGSKAASAKTGTIVWHSATESAVSSTVQSEIAPLLQKVSATPGVGQVVSPFTAGNSAQVSKDGHTAYATVVITSKAKASTIEKLATDASTADLSIQTGGSEFTNQTPSESSELIGIIAPS